MTTNLSNPFKLFIDDLLEFSTPGSLRRCVHNIRLGVLLDVMPRQFTYLPFSFFFRRRRARIESSENVPGPVANKVK